jgi:hypothetical protein
MADSVTVEYGQVRQEGDSYHLGFDDFCAQPPRSQSGL